AAQVLITDSDNGTPNQLVQDSVPPHDVKVFNLGPRNADQCGTTLSCPNLSYKAFRIQTSIPVVVYQFNPLNNTSQAFSNDATLLLPSNALDPAARGLTAEGLGGNRSRSPPPEIVPGGAFIPVVATQDPPTGVAVTSPAGVTFNPPQGATVNGQVI